MPRSLWTGAISFGLVSVPVRLTTAVRDKDIHFHMLSPDGTCRLRRKLYCPDTGKEYDFSDTARGYEVAPDQYVLISDEELDSVKPEKGDTIEIEDFVELSAVDPIYFDKTYYLLPGDGGAKAYKLLRDAMADTGRAALAHFTMRQKQHLVIVRTLDDALVLHTLFFADEVTLPEEFEDDLKLDAKMNKNERATAEKLIEALAADFDPAKYKDEYRERLAKMLDKKAEGKEITVASEDGEEVPETYSLMDALKKSVETAKKKSTGGSTRSSKKKKKTTRRKSA